MLMDRPIIYEFTESELTQKLTEGKIKEIMEFMLYFQNWSEYLAFQKKKNNHCNPWNQKKS